MCCYVYSIREALLESTWMKGTNVAVKVRIKIALKSLLLTSTPLIVSEFHWDRETTFLLKKVRNFDA